MKREVLIVEDDQRFRKTTKLALKGRGFTFYEAGSVQEGIDCLAKRQSIQVILLDLELPKRDGSELLEHIRERASKYRVIVLTAHEEYLAAEKAKAYDVFSYQAKAEVSFAQSLIFEIERAFWDLEKADLNAKMESHLEIQERINSNGDLNEILDLISCRTLELSGAYTCHIRLFDHDRGDFVLKGCKGALQHVETIFSERKTISEAYSGKAAQTGKSEIIDDLQNDEPFKEMKAEILRKGDVGPAVREYLDRVQSAYIVPIRTGILDVGVDAVLNINSDSKNFFSGDSRRKLVDDFVTQMALAISKHWLRERRIAIHSAYRNLSEMLDEVSNELQKEDALDNIYDIVFRRISSGLAPEIITIFLFNTEKNGLEKVAEWKANRRASVSSEIYPIDKGLVGWVYSNGETIRLPNPQRDLFIRPNQDDRYDPSLTDELVRYIPSGRFEHCLCVPIKIGNQKMGVICAINKKSDVYEECHDVGELRGNSLCLLKRGFSEDCQTELEIAASHLAVALQNSELIRKLNKKVSQLEGLYSIGRKISSETNVDEMLKLIVRLTAGAMDADICMLFLKNETGDRVVLSQCYGMPDIIGAFYKLGEGKTGKVAQLGVSILEKQARGDHKGKYDDQIVEFLREKHMDSTKNIETFMAVPIVVKGEFLGVIKVVNKLHEPFYFDEDDQRLFEILAAQIGLERFQGTVRVYLRSIIENSPDPIIVLDENGNVEVFNKACEELWGYTTEWALGRSVTEFYQSAEYAREIGAILRRNPENRIQNFEANIRDTNGTIIPVSLSASFLFNDDGIKIGSLGVFKDQRKEKELQDQMLQAEKLATIGRLTHSVGHNVKTDIGTGLAYLEALLSAYGGEGKLSSMYSDSELVSIFTDMKDALWDASVELKNLLMTGTPKPPQKAPFPITTILSRVREQMHRQAAAQRIAFEISYTDTGSQLLVDIEQMQQVLTNFFNNSIYAIAARRNNDKSFKDGRIEVSADIGNDYLEVTWRDDGCGISENYIPKIFDAFVTDKQLGTGLGLFSVKTIIENHGGRVSVNSELGCGTCFRLELPLFEDTKIM